MALEADLVFVSDAGGPGNHRVEVGRHGLEVGKAGVAARHAISAFERVACQVAGGGGGIGVGVGTGEGFVGVVATAALNHPSLCLLGIADEVVVGFGEIGLHSHCGRAVGAVAGETEAFLLVHQQFREDEGGVGGHGPAVGLVAVLTGAAQSCIGDGGEG